MENYAKTLKALSEFISDFQHVKIVTSVFEFLERISPNDYGPSHRKELLQQEFGNVWTFLNRFNDCLIQLDGELREIYLNGNKKEVKQVIEEIQKSLDRIDIQLEPGKVKKKIRKDYTDENLYDDIPFGSLSVKATKPHIWPKFKIEMLDIEYLFDDYFAMLCRLFEAIKNELELFKGGFPQSNKESEPAGNSVPVEFFYKYSTRIQDYIEEGKWNAFIKICDDYSKNQIRSGIGDFQAIKKIGIESYEWIGINGQVSESLAMFITALKYYKYLDTKGFNFRYSLVFIKFFNLKKRPKWLSTRIDNDLKEAIRIFHF